MAAQPQGIPLIGPLLTVIFGTRNERFVKKYTAHVRAIGALEPEMRRLTDAELRDRTRSLRERVAGGAKAIEVMDEAFAVAREAMDRGVGIRNVFNPRYAEQFDASRLPESVRALYEKTKAEMEALPPAAPEGAFLGCTEEMGGWAQADIPNEIYEAVRELYPESRPPFRSRPFDVQLIGAMVLFQGKIAEMKTGEGKTIVAPLAAFLATLEGQKVHVVTVNDYLVQRDRDWTFPFFRALGLTVGAIHPMHMQDENEKRRMYQCDVVYGTTAEFGFDYLRDNMKRSVEQQVQRVRQMAIVDEVDSILIDEARTPLIISGQAHEDAPRYELADRLARVLVEKQKPWAEADEHVEACKRRIKGLEGDIRNARDRAKVPAMQEELKRAKAELPGLEEARDRHTRYFEVEMDRKQAHLTHEGIDEAQKTAGLGSFYVGQNVDMPHLLTQSVRAHTVYQRDRDYIVAPMPDPQTGRETASVVIVDTFTGRPMVGRQWSDGLHQAVEAKEGAPIKQETQTVATITIQNFFKMYKRLAGMTGTADTEAQEFHDIYKLDVVSIPTNLLVIRKDFDDIVFLTGKDKWTAIVDEIKSFHDMGRPVLVGTTSVEKSEKLAEMLSKAHGIKHEVLNAKQHEREAHIVENAGQLGAVMIATNMAGRGTDIKLGRVSREVLLDHWLRRGIAPKELTTDASDERVRELVFRKVAPKELGVTKQDVEKMSAEEVELALLRKWVSEKTWVDDKAAAKLTAEQLREELDKNGRFGLHRIGWAQSVEELGGLHVIGTERHESRRIDNQLRGRSGRQGDRGSTRFFVGLDDDLMKMFAGETTMRILARIGMKEGDSIEHPMLTKSVERAQRKVEERNFQIRKNILEYDEVMEHQRQSFYGLRQRALEGRDIKGLILEFIRDSVESAVEEYLDPDHWAECVAEEARKAMNASVEPSRLRGVDRPEVKDRVRKVAKADARETIAVTLGEYMPAGDTSGHDLSGLASWARQHFGVEVSAEELQGKSAKDVGDVIAERAAERLDAADLSALDKYLVENYGANELCRWAKGVFGIEVQVEEITGSPEARAGALDLVYGRVEEAYRKKEIEYPVEFAMELTAGMMAYSPDQALGQLATWARTRLGLEWDVDTIRSMGPMDIRDALLKASRARLESGRVEALLEEGAACETREELEKFFEEKVGAPAPGEWVFAGKDPEERREALKGRVEMAARAEMFRFEQFVLLEVLDQAWKDHLYAMDQLRDSINYRAFSQQDPRIEYKREGSSLFREFERGVRERVAELVFRVRLMPQAAPAQAPAAPPARRQGAPVFGGGSISGPGIDG
ncbi:MAG: preprotein translocase subunit SecA [Phycisphaerales bacterium]